MKRLTTILLLSAIFFQTFSTFVIQAEYFLNKSYIARVLCINKAKPKMHCNGKCYLAKKLREEEKKEQQSPNPRNEKFELQPFFLPETFSIGSDQLIAKTEYYNPEEFFHAGFPHTIFHPPTI